MIDLLALDLIRIIHLLAIAIGLGTMVFTDLTTLRRVEQPVGGDYLKLLDGAHAIMMPALLVAWASGIALIGARTGFDIGAFTPKLWCKLFVVTGLTVTAVLVRHKVMPILRASEGSVLMELPLDQKLVLGVIASLSMSGWGMALVLGASTAVKTAGWDVLFGCLLLGYAAALSVALIVTHALHARVRRFLPSAERIAAE